MLSSSRRILRRAGRTAFYAIEIPPGLSPEDYERATEGTNREMRQDQPTVEMLDACGFDVLDVVDVTDGYLEVARRWLRTATELEDGLRATLGDEVYDECLGVRRRGLALTEAGLHVRMFYAARAAG